MSQVVARAVERGATAIVLGLDGADVSLGNLDGHGDLVLYVGMNGGDVSTRALNRKLGVLAGKAGAVVVGTGALREEARLGTRRRWAICLCEPSA